MQTIAERNATVPTTQQPRLMGRVRETLRVRRYARRSEAIRGKRVKKKPARKCARA